MKKKESSAKKAGKGNTKPDKKPGRGGARAGAGRKSKFGGTQQISIDSPPIILAAMADAGITNKTAYFVYLAANDLAGRDVTNEQALELATVAEFANPFKEQ